MANPSATPEAAYEEAHRLGDTILSDLRTLPTDESLDRLSVLLEQREACIGNAGNLLSGSPHTEGSLRTLRRLLDQQQVLEREMHRTLGDLRQSWESNGQARTKVDGAKRMLGYQGTSRQLNAKR